MKTLLALFIPLLSLNLYGEDEPIPSFTGLEGWGKKEGVNIVVEDYSNLQKTYDVKAIKNQVELKLRLAGVKISKKVSYNFINIEMQPNHVGGRVTGYYIRVSAARTMTFNYNGMLYRVNGSSNNIYGGVTNPNYRPELDKYLDELLLDYLKANPKK